MNAFNSSGDCPTVSMTVDTRSSFWLRPFFVIVAITIALLATAVSLGIAAYAGWLRGGTPLQRAMSVALACVAALYTHLFPTGWRAFSAPTRVAGAALWIVAIVAVTIGQMTFFIESQRDAGNWRAASVPVVKTTHPPDVPRVRNLAAIAEDRVQVVADLARIEAYRCMGNCQGIAVRKARLAAQLVALDAEMTEGKRHEAEDDRLVAQAERADALRSSLRVDLVVSQVAFWLGTTESRLELMQAAMFAVVLEGAAMMSWLLVARVWPPSASRGPVALSRAVQAMVVELDEPVYSATEPVEIATSEVAATVSEDDRVLDEIHAEVAAGRLKPTQRAIRAFLECGQAAAGHFARLYRERSGGADVGGRSHGQV
ncbi:hypothetical protein PQR11_15700 [Paraburkholderia strydomiana]|jgi:hypothetical protein|uniref:hypothetical protein n=1 Tax=Paraburkholderia strydomiana TaxID=1245417 RepID=UPI0038B843C4